MIWQCDATVTRANDELIRLNKFISRITKNLCSLFYYYYSNTSMWYHCLKQWLCRVPQALDKDQKTLGKGFAECNTRQTAHCIYSVGKQLFAECLDTRQKKVVCWVFFQNTLGKGLLFAECFWELHSANLFFKEKNIFFSAYYYCLWSVFRITLGKPIFQRKKNSQHIRQLCFFFAPWEREHWTGSREVAFSVYLAHSGPLIQTLCCLALVDLQSIQGN